MHTHILEAHLRGTHLIGALMTVLIIAALLKYLISR
jgi:hypothetical protein